MADEEDVEGEGPQPEEGDKPPPDGQPLEKPIYNKQKLFLLEFIIDDLSLDFCNAKQLICYGDGKTVIEFKFLDIGPLRIIEDDFMPVRKHYLEGCTGTGSVKNGKSVLFGLTQAEAEDAAQRAIIYNEIIKKTHKKEYRLGVCMVRIINLFKDLLRLVAEGGRPYYHRNVKDCYKIKDITSGELVGHMFAYIRLSCFNEIIVNKVKKDPSQEMDYAVDKEGHYSYRYNKGSKEMVEPPCECKANVVTDVSEEPPCKCPEELPAPTTCPQIYTDNQCVFDCAQNLRPCQACPPTCAENRAAGKVRIREFPVMKSARSSKSGKSGKSGGTKSGGTKSGGTKKAKKK